MFSEKIRSLKKSNEAKKESWCIYCIETCDAMNGIEKDAYMTLLEKAKNCYWMKFLALVGLSGYCTESKIMRVTPWAVVRALDMLDGKGVA